MPSIPGASTAAKALQFDVELLSILRLQCGVASTPDHICEVSGPALVRLFGVGNVLIVGLETPSKATDSRDDVISNLIFPKNTSARFLPQGATTSAILSTGQYWVEHVPSYVGNRRGTFSEYAILVLRTGRELSADDAALLAHVAKAIGHSVSIAHEAAALRQSTRAVSRSNLLTRLADDYLGYEFLKLAKEVGAWKSLALWRYSQLTQSLEKLAEENRDQSPLWPARLPAGTLSYVMKTQPSCRVLAIEHGSIASGRAVQLVSAISGSRDIASRVFEFRSPTDRAQQIHIAVPRPREPYDDRAWIQLEALCRGIVALALERPVADDRALDLHFAPDDVICVLPFAEGSVFEAALVCHLGPAGIKAGKVAFVRSVVDRCVATLAGLSQMHERLAMWADAVSQLQNVATTQEFHDRLESVSRELFDGSGVILWQSAPGTVKPRYCSSLLNVLELEAEPADLELADDSPLFFGRVHPSRQEWLKKVEQLFVSSARRERSSVAWETRRYESVSGFLVPIRTAGASYLLAIVRDRISGRRQMDLTLCNVVRPIMAEALGRFEREERETQTELNTYRAAASDGSQLPHEFCRLLARNLEATSALLLYTDEDLGALSTASHFNAAGVAEIKGLIAPSASTLAGLCYIRNAPLYGTVNGPSIAVQRFSANGSLDSETGTCEYLGWLPGAASAMAMPLSDGTRKYGVAIVAWSDSLTVPHRTRAYWQMVGLCETFNAVTRERRLDREARLREKIARPVSTLRRFAEPTLAPDPPERIVLPPELDQLFPAGVRAALAEVFQHVVSELPCLSVTLRLLDHFRVRLFRIAAGGSPGAAAQYTVADSSSVSAYCVLNYPKYRAISLPRIANGIPQMGIRYDGLVYAGARSETRSELCLPLVSKSDEGQCVGTINFESSAENGFQQVRGACEELRALIEEVVDRRVASARGELLRHIEYMGHLFAQEHHSLKDMLSLAERQILEVSDSSVTEPVTQVFAVQRLQLIKRIETLDSLRTRAGFAPGIYVERALSRTTAGIGPWLEVVTDLDEPSELTYGNPWLFEHAVENTLWQVIGFLRIARDRDPDHPRFTVQVRLHNVPRERACLLAIGHDGPKMRPELEPMLFWYRITSAEKGTGMGLALTGFEYRSMQMYPRASAAAPHFFPEQGDRWATWFTVHIPFTQSEWL